MKIHTTHLAQIHSHTHQHPYERWKWRRSIYENMCQPQRATAHFFWSCEYFFSAIFLSSVLGLSLLHAYFTLLFINSWANVLGAGILDALRHYNGWAACFVHNRIQIVVNLWTYIIMCLSIISIIITLFLAFISCSRPILFLARVFYVFFLIGFSCSHSYFLLNSSLSLSAYRFTIECCLFPT